MLCDLYCITKQVFTIWKQVGVAFLAQNDHVWYMFSKVFDIMKVLSRIGFSHLQFEYRQKIFSNSR